LQEEEVSVTEQQQEQKAPVVEIKKAPSRRTTSKAKAAQPKAKPEVDLTRLAEVSQEISRLEVLKKERLDLINKAAKAGATTKQISDASGLSVPRLRQLIEK
jgi:hypothetical protein